MNKITAHYSQLVMPDHINNVGTLFGGQMVSWMDLAAAKTAHRFLRDSEAWGAVTRAIEKVEFRNPVYAGDWVNFIGTVVSSGTSSIVIRVEAHRENRKAEKQLACTARIIMVAVIEKEKGKFVKFNHGISLEK